MRLNNREIEMLREQVQGKEEQIQRLEAENKMLGERNEEIFSRMSLRDKVKYIFKKYGFTVIGILAAAGTVIGSLGPFIPGKISRGLHNPRLLLAANCSYKRHKKFVRGLHKPRTSFLYKPWSYKWLISRLTQAADCVIHGRGYASLLSHRKLKETIFNANYIQLIDFSPSTVPFCVSSDLVECETNTGFGFVLGLSLGGMGRDFPKLKTSKSRIDTGACKMEMPNSGVIYSSRKNYARVHLRIFHGSKEVLPLEMKQTSFFLQLDRSEDEKVMATDYE